MEELGLRWAHGAGGLTAPSGEGWGERAGRERGQTRKNPSRKSSEGSRGHGRAPPPQVLLSAHPVGQLNWKDHGAAPGSRLSPKREPTAFPPLAVVTFCISQPQSRSVKGLPAR